MTSTLVRTGEQRTESLRKANDVRLARAQLKRRLAAREVEAWRLLKDPPGWLLTMRVEDLLRAQRGWSFNRACRTLRAVMASESKTVGGLSQRQRAELVRLLGGEAAAGG